MCGINLIISRRREVDHSVIEKMTSMTRHRGPDDTRVVIEKKGDVEVHMAANRLKITDQTEFAAQPFSNGLSKKYLLFNGEIYNYRQLKNKLLDRGLRFQTDSDTEVLYNWLTLYGVGGLAELEGMFALVFVDLENDEILIARDRSGIKVLYYFEDSNLFIASSEINPIVECGLVAKQLNTSQIDHYLYFKYAAPPETFFKGIYEISPGEVLSNKNAQWEKKRFLSENSRDASNSIDLRIVEELLTDSLLDQLEPKVSLGLLLSGGIDSSLLLALAHKHGISVPTFSVLNSLNEKTINTGDNKYSRIAAGLFQSDHHELVIDSSILENFDQFISNLDQPIGDSSYLLTAEICKYASGSMKVLLSGAGADELFGGYNRHWAFYKYLRHLNLLKLGIPVGKPLLQFLPTGIRYPWQRQVGHLKKLAESFDSSPAKTWMNFIGFNEFNYAGNATMEKHPDQTWLSWALHHDRKNYLVSDILAVTDKASMRHSVEVRVPYLSEKLITYVNSVPEEEMLKGGRKWPLRKLLIDNGGARLVNRPKEGFGMPFGQWIKDGKVDFLLESFFNENSVIFEFVLKDTIGRILYQHNSSKQDHGTLLWSIMVLTHWLNKHY